MCETAQLSTCFSGTTDTDPPTWLQFLLGRVDSLRVGSGKAGRVRQSRCANSLAYFPHHQSQLEIQEVPWNTRKHLPFYCTVFPHAVLGLACPMSSWLLWCVTPQLPLTSLASGYSNCYVRNIEGDPTAKESSSGSPTPLSNGHLCSLC